MGEQENNKESEVTIRDIFKGLPDYNRKARNVSEEKRDTKKFFENLLREIYYGDIGRVK